MGAGSHQPPEARPSWWDLLFAHGMFALPLRGLRWKEKNRIFKLARSGKRIEDPEDSHLVRELILWELHRPTTRENVIGWTAASVLLSVLGLILWVGGKAIWRFVPGPLAATLFFFFVEVAWVRPRFRKTAKENGWRID